MTAPGERLLTIGQAASAAGVTPRTLRYYEELGLLSPAGKTTGGARRYDQRDVDQLLRIRELQEVMGFNLDEIAVIMQAERRLSDIREEWFSSEETPEQRIALLAEATAINDGLQGQVRTKLERLLAFQRDLEEKAAKYEERRQQLEADRSVRPA